MSVCGAEEVCVAGLHDGHSAEPKADCEADDGAWTAWASSGTTSPGMTLPEDGNDASTGGKRVEEGLGGHPTRSSKARSRE